MNLATKILKNSCNSFQQKKIKLKLPENQQLAKSTLSVKQQITQNLNSQEKSPDVHIITHFDHKYGQL
jgi:hypothetical protein